MKKYLVPAIGAVAFVIGGILAREKAIEGIETLEKTFAKNKQSSVPTPAE